MDRPSTTWLGTATWLILLLVGDAATAAEARLADAVERRAHAQVTELLAADNVNLDAPQADGMTALHWAVYHQQVELVRNLVERGAQVSAANRYGVSPLSLACQNGEPEVVKLLLEAGADPNVALPGGETALMTAARTGKRRIVEALLTRGADANSRERKGQTALMWAAAEGHTEVVSALLNAGAKRDTALSSGFTALFFAIREGRTATVLRLLEAGCDVNDVMRTRRNSGGRGRLRTSPLLLAVENGHLELAQKLVAAGADPNSSPAGYSALHAITWVRKPIRGDGDPPPIGSGSLDSLTFVKYLVGAGADVNQRLERGKSGAGRFATTGSTPFVLAARSSDIPLLKLLTELGADPKIPNADGCTALLAATGVGALGDGDESAGTEEEALATVKLLLEMGADIDAVDDRGETAMHGAAYQDRPAVVGLLADAGANIDVWNRKNQLGWTPYMIALGYRPGNFRPAPDSMAKLAAVMRAAGVEPPKMKDLPPHKRVYGL